METTILDKILAEKEKEISMLKQTFHPAAAAKSPKTSLYDRFYHSEKMNVIAEIKRASPSKGEINFTVDPTLQAKRYEEYGADAISVLTDTPFFKGSMADLQLVRQAVDVPVLCKDFIIDEIQIDRALAAGADVILLIAAALCTDRLGTLYSYAKEKELDVLLEVHNEPEMEMALSVDADVIGINNRDLKSFVVDLGVTERLLNKYDHPGKIFISESGFQTASDVERVKQAGARGILVGEALMKSENISRIMMGLKISL
ncbi:indole-3-glycerol phosphate synthase TrpC [Mesobacillus zeae]|uniref:Indole-3-glycerol phosphate synthase n=1 Tax=Mesobacillus zeae TaxID=1917180 RepID=A0A398BGP3_9BACI|nr:indole-3-glycerol phosphate synthase TrpC [Mesobacillus zeae]RID86800.1 indole-3-glycerol phosphate synthase TrpC [Mesobacillus zeae]